MLEHLANPPVLAQGMSDQDMNGQRQTARRSEREF